LGRFLSFAEPLFRFSAARAVGRRAGRIPCGGLVKPWASDGVMLMGDAAGQVSPATGGGIRLAFQLGRRCAQAVADYLLHMGPRPEVAVAPDLPALFMKRALRFGLDCKVPNAVISAAIGTSPMRQLAQRVFFHNRGSKGMRFDEFQARLAQLSNSLVAPAPPGTTQ
jgi:hypothetical protein